MNAHEFASHGAPPAAICPSIEVLVHRRATELIADRPRRRVMTLSSVGGVAVAAVCAVLVLVIGSPSGSGLLSPRQAVAAVVQNLNGDGILHWVRSEKLTGAQNPSAWSERGETEEWIDLSDGDSHTITRAYRGRESQPETRVKWISSGIQWNSVPSGDGAPLTIRAHRSAERFSGTAVSEIRETLERAERGEVEIADAGEDRGQPVVVVTERREGIVRRVWITREDVPRLVRSETTVTARNAPQPIVTTSTTTIWQVLPRTPESLADVEIPTDAKRVP